MSSRTMRLCLECHRSVAACSTLNFRNPNWKSDEILSTTRLHLLCLLHLLVLRVYNWRGAIVHSTGSRTVRRGCFEIVKFCFYFLRGMNFPLLDYLKLFSKQSQLIQFKFFHLLMNRIFVNLFSHQSINQPVLQCYITAVNNHSIHRLLVIR